MWVDRVCRVGCVGRFGPGFVGGGLVVEAASVAAGVSDTAGWRWFQEAGGVMPRAAVCEESCSYRLSFSEREEIACRRAAGAGVRQIARELGRSPSTISRELGRARRKGGYRASVAQSDSQRRAARPKLSRLAVHARLREDVQQWLEDKLSPEQISHRLRLEFPDDPEMRVSHETIYQSLYVQGRGTLRRELAACLRTGRAERVRWFV